MDYQKQASAFLAQYHLSLSVIRDQKQAPAPWSEGKETGVKYIVRLKSMTKEVVFPFWGSIADKAKGEKPSAYDVLSCISLDCCCPNRFKMFCEEYGYSEDSRSALSAWNRCREFSKKLQAFFTPEQIDALQEIQ